MACPCCQYRCGRQNPDEVKYRLEGTGSRIELLPKYPQPDTLLNARQLFLCYYFYVVWNLNEQVEVIAHESTMQRPSRQQMQPV